MADGGNSNWDARAAALDDSDPLAGMRARFALPDGVIYLDGNSLGPLPKTVVARMANAVADQWGQGLIRSWNSAGWIDLPSRVGERIAKLVGAGPGTVVATDSTSVNLFKMLSASLALRPGRRKIVSERGNFPTDLYMAQGLAALLDQGHELVLIDEAEALPNALANALEDDVAVLMLTHVNYRTGAMHDMAGLSQAAHRAGALTVWDLAHSAGAVPLDLAGTGADFAVGCGYKFLNGGPGAPAFLYVAPKHQNDFSQPLSGWFGHEAPFAFEPDYRPAAGIARYLCGTPPVLSLAALDEALALWDEVDLVAVRAKSIAQADFFIQAVEALCPGHGLQLATPRAGNARGSQVSFTRSEGAYAIMQCLIAHGVIGDFRAPDILRFGITPLYLSYADLLSAARCLADILQTGAWDRAEFHARAKVT